MNITVKQIQYFLALVELKHFGQAAELCSITQPALTIQIQLLEGQLGKKLFEKSYKSIHLTRFGEQFLQKAHNIIRELNDIYALTKSDTKVLSGTMTFGAIPTIAPYLLPKLIERISQTQPSLEIHLRESITETLLKDLKYHRIDVAIIALPFETSGFEVAPLFEENFVLARACSDQTKFSSHFDHLKGQTWLMLEAGHCLRDQTIDFCKTRGLVPNQTHECTSLSTLVQMASMNMGVTLIPEMAAEIESRHTDITIEEFSEPYPKRTIAMVWRQSNPLQSQLHDLAKDLSKYLT